jgi:hypothetical protein
MTDRPEPMDIDALAALVDGQIADAREYNRTSLAQSRELALDFIRGEVDLENEEGKSSVTSRDLSDILGWIMPSLLRVFLAATAWLCTSPTSRSWTGRQAS